MHADSQAADLDLEGLEQALNNINLSSNRSQDETIRAAKALAEASKHDLSIRRNLGKPLPLQQLVAIIDCSLNDSLEAVDVALRCIGNACIDNDTGRQNITDIGFSWASRCLMAGDPATAELTAQVLYNICLGFEPAEQQCFRDNVHIHFIDFFAGLSAMSETLYPLLPELLLRICSHKDALQDPAASQISHVTLTNLFWLPRLCSDRLEPEDWSALIELCLIFLRDVQVQQDAVRREQAQEFWDMLVANETYMESHFDDEDLKLLIPQSTSLIWIISDVAALPEFSQRNNVKTPWIQDSVVLCIVTGPGLHKTRLYTAACQVIGNVLWSAKSSDDCAYLVEERLVHEALFRYMATQDVELLHASAGVLLQLTRSSVRLRERIASGDWTDSRLELLCKHENPLIRQDGLRLLRALGQGSPSIQERFAELARHAMIDAAAAVDIEATNSDTSMMEVPD